jgi:phage RecT family recombinase
MSDKTPARNTDPLREYLWQHRDRLAELLPPALGLTPERMIKLACLYMRGRTDLRGCTHDSILASLGEAASLGLEIGGPLAEGHLVPFDDKKAGTRQCTFMPDYKGLLKLARRSGEFGAIEAVEVYRADEFEIIRDPRPTVRHIPSLDGPRGPAVHVYAYAALKTGEIVFEHMTALDVEEIRARSRSKDSPAWRNSWGEMAKKVVLKRLLKRQARSVAVARAMAIDDRDYALDAASPGDWPTSGTGTARATVKRPERGVAGVRAGLGIGQEKQSARTGAQATPPELGNTGPSPGAATPVEEHAPATTEPGRRDPQGDEPDEPEDLDVWPVGRT